RPDDREFLYGHANAAMWLRRFGVALGDATRLVRLHPEDAEAWALRARVRAARRQPRAAVADLDRALALRPDALEWLIAKADMLIELDDAAGALGVAEHAVSLGPTDRGARITLSHAFSKRGEHGAAIEVISDLLP